MPEPAALRQLRLDGGPADGSRLIEVTNAAGLSVDLLPDRCLDLGQVRLNGVPFAWVGPNGLAPAAPGEMDLALGGLMCTCGFDHIRQPEAHRGGRYPLHGSMSLRRAQVEAAWVRPDGSAKIRARVVHGVAGGASWTLVRRITIPADRAEIAIEDEVELRSPADGDRVMALYHVNLGPPLIGPDTVVTVAGQPRPDLPGSAPGTFCEPDPLARRWSRLGAGSAMRASCSGSRLRPTSYPGFNSTAGSRPMAASSASSLQRTTDDCGQSLRRTGPDPRGPSFAGFGCSCASVAGCRLPRNVRDRSCPDHERDGIGCRFP